MNHRALLTHEGKYQARAAGRVIAAARQRRVAGHRTRGRVHRDGRPRRRAAGDLHRPGGRLRRAHRGRREKAGRKIRAAEYDISAVAGASVYDDAYVGRAKLVIDDERDVAIGATFAGYDVGEMLHSATIAIVGEVPIQRLWHAVPSYPTLSEIWLRLLETDGRA